MFENANKKGTPLVERRHGPCVGADSSMQPVLQIAEDRAHTLHFPKSVLYAQEQSVVALSELGRKCIHASCNAAA